MKILLTDEEIKQAIEAKFPFMYPQEAGVCELTAKAQLKKIVGWGSESCPHAKIFTTKIGTPYSTKYKRECSECWQALLKEVEDE